MIRLLLVDGHRLFRLGLISLLECAQDIVVVGEATTGIEAVQWTRYHSADVILMDINLPEMNALEAAQRIRTHSPQANILILTAHRGNIYPARLFNAGVLGYLTKASEPDDLLLAIRRVADGSPYLSSSLAKQLASQRFGEHPEAVIEMENLSDKELGVVSMLIDGKETVAIAREMRLGVSTVNCYRHRIFKKLKIKSAVELLHLAKRAQLID